MNQSPAELIEQILAECALAADHVSSSVTVIDHSLANLRWAANELTSNGIRQVRQVSVMVAVHTPAGVCATTVTTTDISKSAGVLANQALAAARACAPAEDARELVPGGANPAFDTPADRTSPGVFADVAPQLGELFAAAAATGCEYFGYAKHTVDTTWLGTSAGTRLRHTHPYGTFELTATSHQRTRSTYHNQPTTDFSDIAVADLAHQAHTRLEWQARTVDLPAGRYTAVLPPVAVTDLMLYLYDWMDARSATEGESVFAGTSQGSTRVGERLTQVPVRLRSDPTHPGVECEPFVAGEFVDTVMFADSNDVRSVFDYGIPIQPVTWIDAGTLVALPSSRYSAQLAGLSPTPPPNNLIIEVGTGQGSLADLIATTDRGLLVTSLWYLNVVDPRTMLVTGLTRDGVYAVENGEVTGRVTNYRFNESPVDLFTRIDAATTSQRVLSRESSDGLPHAIAPALRVHEFNFSTISPGT